MTNAVSVGIAVQADWENREFISNISLNVRRLFEFVLQFGEYGGCIFLRTSATKNKLAIVNEKLDALERRLEMLEVQLSTASASTSVFR
ncbi:BRICK 1 protein [Nymphaea thermarum]|nr:BRICK 1 protein [Nymphaea thermarum]